MNNNQSNKPTIKVRKPKSKEEFDMMYQRSYYIGKFLLHEIPSRLNKFIDWLKKCKEDNIPIRFIYNNKIYDFEILNKKTKKWIRIGKITSKALIEEKAR
jgi:hypothetical protein